ncbi:MULTISPECIES: TetR/AcrR family transcriptional regulator [Mycolicibacterium]|uniref:Transcriptional regulator, TetR family n=2 Tax=Mycolicibacterium TaxID=1866885 RepID=A1T491_MYCVP|nr:MULTISPECIES: TetR family transcriptional regulator [Mycolicibacterium]ABM11991.1 transcriptional regulator, TetR family [Mycolicibacterium vanbaalenii PYR-1]MCV7129958.1 TetR family transcriptional regulator [Mycolicibacterium vanbaalenii PYR-1]MDN4517646.1 TetR family transcriptional regulator [Mycolicibacterium austroafricanum]MDW5614094.1 TetR family transcriptional regulator [Mycolicibacterium sp. D5.8-2]PQP45155.1 TetR family transcriptional regulator [Mycolicibacterium austroafricanu
MSGHDRPQSLRERKKVRTRLAIRREAFRLFAKQGYANTTVEQIAEAADVSPRTFYRYFGVKERLLISDDKISPIVEAFIAAPKELPIVPAYRHAVGTVFDGLTQEERDDFVAGEQMMYAIPEARGLVYTEYVRLIDLIADALTDRPDGPTDEMERRVVAGAIVGVLIAASHNNPFPEDVLLRSLEILGRRLT